ncbi:hypothetical protein NSQ26_09980 [Bacillus sp. FSL W7-1360]
MIDVEEFRAYLDRHIDKKMELIARLRALEHKERNDCHEEKKVLA